MTHDKRLVSSVLLAAGVLVIFAGLTAALGFTPGGMLASIAAIATLLYAGGVWFGAPAAPAAPDTIRVFDRSMHIVCGSACGAHVLAHFPESARRDIEARCAAVFLGQSARFSCEENGQIVGFDVTPVRAADGTVLYGILISGTAASAPAVAACIAS